MRLFGILLFFVPVLYAAESSYYIKKIYEVVPKSVETKVKEIKIEFKKIKGLEVNEKCFKQKSCKALEALSSKIPTAKVRSVSRKKLIGDPASQTCLELGGRNLILTDSDNKEFDFCEMDDGSIFNSWQFHYLKYPKKNIVE